MLLTDRETDKQTAIKRVSPAKNGEGNRANVDKWTWRRCWLCCDETLERTLLLVYCSC